MAVEAKGDASRERANRLEAIVRMQQAALKDLQQALGENKAELRSINSELARLGRTGVVVNAYDLYFCCIGQIDGDEGCGAYVTHRGKHRDRQLTLDPVFCSGTANSRAPRFWLCIPMDLEQLPHSPLRGGTPFQPTNIHPASYTSQNQKNEVGVRCEPPSGCGLVPSS